MDANKAGESDPMPEDLNSKSRLRPLSPTVIGDLLRFADMAIVGTVAIVIYFIYVHPNFGSLNLQYMVTIAIAVVACGAVFQWLGVYAGDFVFAKGLRANRILAACAITFAMLLATAFALKISSFYSRVWLVSWFVFSVGFLALTRMILGAWIRRQTVRGAFADRTVIVGTGAQGRRLMDYLRQTADIRVGVLGLIDDRPGPRDGNVTARENANVLGDMDELVELIRDNRVDQVLVALPWNEEDRVQDVVQRLAMTPVHIGLAPDLAGYHFAGRGLHRIGQLPVLSILSRPMSGWSQVIKVAEDRFLAAAFLVVLALPMAAIWLAVKFGSPGPALFRQQRKGFNDNLIEVWKFRTMREHEEGPNGVVQAVRGDPRVTGIGRFLRRTSLDELPQLFNVLRGEMSIVGPRPHPVALRAKGHLFEDIVDQYAARHRVKPGITGWAQVNGWRGETDTIEKAQKRVEFDLDYIDNWSIWFDLYIIARTVIVLFKNSDTY